MIKFEKTEVTGWEPAIRGMRNPMNSWERSDSIFVDIDGEYYDILGNQGPACGAGEIGSNDQDLMIRLAKAGSEHAKYRRMIVVTVDITAPLYWWKEFDTYKVGTVVNSCSTMHKIHAKEFTLEDFSCEHLLDWPDIDIPGEFGPDNPLELGDMPVVLRNRDNNSHFDETDKYLYYSPEGALKLLVEMLNRCRMFYLKTKDKTFWWQMIQLLPSSYNQKRTVMLNYEVLARIYPKRKNHKLDEWHEFCQWIKLLPCSEIITLQETDDIPIYSMIDLMTFEEIFKDFQKQFPEYAKRVIDYRPGNEPYTIIVWLDAVNAVTQKNSIIYDYKLKKVRTDAIFDY